MANKDTINLVDQVNPDTTVGLDYNLNSEDVKATVNYNINQNTSIEVSHDSEGNTNASLTIKF